MPKFKHIVLSGVSLAAITLGVIAVGAPDVLAQANSFLWNINTTTNVASLQYAGRVISIPDPGTGASTILTSKSTFSTTTGISPTRLALLQAVSADGSVVGAAAAAGKFGWSISLGTSSGLVTEAANTNTKTDDALVDFTLPNSYKAGANLTVNAFARITGAGTAGTKTVKVKAYRVADNGTHSADLIATVATAITAAGADVPFTVTGTTLAPGDRLWFEVEVVLQETAGTDIFAVVNSLRVS